MKPDLVIFDCDGVLIDSEWIACEIDVQVLSEFGLKLAPEDLARQFTGIARRDMFASLTEQYDLKLPDDLDDQVEQRIRQHYLTDIQPINGAAQFVHSLSMPVCVASSSRPSSLALGLVRTNLFDLFYPNIYSSLLVSRGKPAPDIFLYAKDKMCVSPDRCIVIEDSVAGIKGAKAAGMKAIGFLGGAHCTHDMGSMLSAAGADQIALTFASLPSILRAL